ncbi:MAG: helix-turn-helix domain-containing protein [Desulfobulbus sp.]|nr:helix-turn-helix domain-containing protein [Desulfobulbus sp.]
MPEALRTPPIDLRVRVRGKKKAEKLIALLRDEFSAHVEVVEDDDDALMDVFEADWYKETVANMTPGGALNALRWKHQITQAELARRIGSQRQTISAIERGRRPLGMKTAVKISAALGEPLSEFFPGGFPVE